MIRNRAHVALAALVALLAAVPCAAEVLAGSGRAATQQRAVSGYGGVAISVPGRVELVQGSSEGVTIDADDNVLPKLETVVERGVLRIRFPRGLTVRPRTPIRLTVRFRSIESIAVAGSATVVAPKLETPRLAVSLTGSAGMLLPDVVAQEITADMSGHCHLMAAGRADALKLAVAGSGEINAPHLDVRRAAVSITGSAQVAAWVRDELRLALVGSGTVHYYGDPSIEKSGTGSGGVERLGATPP